MDQVHFGPWEILCEPLATRRAYSAIPAGGPEQCGCDPCVNFAAARDRIYPPEALQLFEQLGISMSREVEVYHLARLDSGLHLYGGWFHFVGSIASGPDAGKQISGENRPPDFVHLNEHFTLGFSTKIALARKPFVVHSLVQLDFTAECPWVISKSEPR